MSRSKMPVGDRRVRKTQELLHCALAGLVHEKPYDAISVKDILDRANVGRSTFYAHFRDKDELLTSAMLDLLRPFGSDTTPSSARRSERTIGFSLPIFEHIHQHRQAANPRIDPGARALLHDRLRETLAQLIADDMAKDGLAKHGLAKDGPAAPKPASRIPPGLLVDYLSSTFVLVLNWWVDSRSALSPREVNDLFRTIALPTLGAAGL